eukprot:1159547-Pelagomonas_calceolata.AAC.20
MMLRLRHANNAVQPTCGGEGSPGKKLLPNDGMQSRTHTCPYWQVLLLVTPGGEKATTIDAEGHMALGVLRALGLPETVLAVQGVSSGPGNRAATGRGPWVVNLAQA